MSLAAWLVAGCTTVEPTAEVAATGRALAGFTGERLRLVEDAVALRARGEAVEALLAAPLSQEGAVRLALLGSPALQALLATRTAEIAESAQGGRIANPVLSYERLRDHGEVDIGRLVSVGLLDMLGWPQRRRIADAELQAAQQRLAITVVDEVTRVRQSWVRAVAAEQRRRYAEQVLESGAASAELARRMEAAGNFNRITRARQQAFEIDARTQAVLARQQAAGTREELIRALGLGDDEAARLQLPPRLPDLPAQPTPAASIGVRAGTERLDVRLAAAEWRAAAARRGLGTATTLTDIELGVRRDSTARGYEVELRLPLLDAGDLQRTALDGRTLAAAAALEATLRAAGSHLRESYAAYLAAHDIARHHRDELVPLRRTIAEESLLRYNGMIIGVFELLADAREQVTTVMAAIEAEQQFWLADAALQSAIAGRPLAVAPGLPQGKAAEPAAGH